MSRSNDAGHFFQTTEALATSERKSAKAANKAGNPIKLPAKILAVQSDPGNDGAVYIAEAAGEIKRVVLQICEVQKVFTQATAPLTSISVCPATKSLFTGSWDKNIYKIPLEGKQASGSLSGHNDFVKCLHSTSLNGKPILISGGADAAILIWDAASGKQLHKLKGHTKALQDLAIDPLSLPDSGDTPNQSLILFTASSDPEIRRWHVGLEEAYELPESIQSPILAHETSVYKLCFDSDGDLWTASADKTAKHLVRSRNWEADTTLQHPDFVRDVVAVEHLGLVATACRDEEVRVWDFASGDLVCTYSGHFEDVTGLVLLGNDVISVSIDGTIRRWGLTRRDIEQYHRSLQEASEVEANGSSEPEKKASLLTEEEEAELAELLEDDDDDK